jgi:hypothetical protein
MAAQMNTHADGDDTTCPHAVVIVLDWINPALQMSLQAPNLGTSTRATNACHKGVHRSKIFCISYLVHCESDHRQEITKASHSAMGWLEGNKESYLYSATVKK